MHYEGGDVHDGVLDGDRAIDGELNLITWLEKYSELAFQMTQGDCSPPFHTIPTAGMI